MVALSNVPAIYKRKKERKKKSKGVDVGGGGGCGREGGDLIECVLMTWMQITLIAFAVSMIDRSAKLAIASLVVKQ